MKHQRGSISLFVLIVGISVSIIMSGLVLLASSLYMTATRTEVYERALGVAEAGIEYYRWHLAHAPTDFQDDTGLPGPYTHTITDPYGNTSGTYQLAITAPSEGSNIITVQSTGWLTSNPEIKRTVTVQYGRPSYARFAFLHNANIWFGAKINIHGKVFSNGGIRMEGTNDSTMQSAKATYTCGSETGCDPAETKPGIWGDGGPQNLWEFPVAPIDFNVIAADFSTMLQGADQNGLHLAPSQAFGYHIKFQDNGSYTVYKVMQVNNKKGWSVETDCVTLGQEINKETLIGTYQVTSKPIVFAEDHIWVEGVVKGRATVVAARSPFDTQTMNIWIPNNITYAARDGTNSLGIIAQNNIYFALDVPQEFEINGALLAQNGRILRHDYKYQGCSMQPGAVRQKLTIFGSVISNQKSYWNYGNGFIVGFGNGPVSGFMQRDITYDPNLLFMPPPYFPSDPSLNIISWQEE